MASHQKGGIMRRLASVGLAGLFVAAAGCVFAQGDSVVQPGGHRVTWSFDPVHGAMLAAPRTTVVLPGTVSAAPADTATAVTYTGTIAITATVKLISALPKGETVYCTAGVGLEFIVEEQLTGTNFGTNSGISQSTESVPAAISGSTATCSFNIPYSWTVPASTATATVIISGITGSVGVAEEVLQTQVIVPRPLESSAAVTTALTATSMVTRSTTVELVGPTTIPADGTTTTLTVGTVL
jgi:hypothetical protein